MTKCTAACDAEKAVLVEAGEAVARGLDWVLTGFPDGGDRSKASEAVKAWRDVLADTPLAAAALLAQGERHKRALVAQVEAHDYRFGPEGEAAETAEELNTFMATAQGLDEEAWRLTCAALSGEEKE